MTLNWREQLGLIQYALNLAYAQFVFEKQKEDGEKVSKFELLSMMTETIFNKSINATKEIDISK